MNSYTRTVFIVLIFSLCLALEGQTAFITSGSDAVGSGGSISSSIGQLTDRTFTGPEGSIAQGVQHPYEIAIATSIEKEVPVTLEYRIYPNPTAGKITLVIRPKEHDDYSYRLYDINGVKLLDRHVESEESEVPMESLSPDVYFLMVIRNNLEVKVFKVIKK